MSEFSKVITKMNNVHFLIFIFLMYSVFQKKFVILTKISGYLYNFFPSFETFLLALFYIWEKTFIFLMYRVFQKKFVILTIISGYLYNFFPSFETFLLALFYIWEKTFIFLMYRVFQKNL